MSSLPSRAHTITVLTTPVCPYHNTCLAHQHGATHCDMDGDCFCDGVEEQVETQQRCVRYHRDETTDQIYFQMDCVYNEVVVRTQYYNCACDLIEGYNITEEPIHLHDVLAYVFGNESDVIDGMPTGTQEQKDAKAAMYGVDWEDGIKVRKEEVT